MRKLTKVAEIKFRGAVEVRTDPFIFRGPVSEAGYEWLTGMDGKPRLVARRVPGLRFRYCKTHPNLYREFSELSPTKAAIQGFAGLYGDLFNRYEPEQGVVRHDRSVSHGASLGSWTQEIGDMHVLVSLWDHINGPQLAELKKVIQRTDKELCYLIETPRRTSNVTLAHADIPGSNLMGFDPDDVLLPARCALQLEINKRIAENPTTPRLAWTPDRHERGNFSLPIFQRIIFEPSNLLAAMWMQFAQAVTEGFQLIQCEGCGKYFQVGPGGKRAHATTCSDACRQRKKRKLL